MMVDVSVGKLFHMDERIWQVSRVVRAHVPDQIDPVRVPLVVCGRHRFEWSVGRRVLQASLAQDLLCLMVATRQRFLEEAIFRARHRRRLVDSHLCRLEVPARLRGVAVLGPS